MLTATTRMDRTLVPVVLDSREMELTAQVGDSEPVGWMSSIGLQKIYGDCFLI